MEMLRAESAGLTFSVVAPSSVAGIRHSENVDEVDANNTNFKQCMINDGGRVNKAKRIGEVWWMRLLHCTKEWQSQGKIAAD